MDKKQRSGLTDDLFVPQEQDQSESSGYTSQQSSYNSLTEQDSVNGTAYPSSNGWTNGPSSLTQWSTAQPPTHNSVNGGPSYSRGRVQSMVDSFQKSSGSSKPEYGYETDISANRKQRRYTTSMYAGEESDEQERRKIPPIKLPKPKHSREMAMGQFAAGGRSVSMSCVANADDNQPNQAPNPAQVPPAHTQRLCLMLKSRMTTISSKTKRSCLKCFLDHNHHKEPRYLKQITMIMTLFQHTHMRCQRVDHLRSILTLSLPDSHERAQDRWTHPSRGTLV